MIRRNLTEQRFFQFFFFASAVTERATFLSPRDRYKSAECVRPVPYVCNLSPSFKVRSRQYDSPFRPRSYTCSYLDGPTSSPPERSQSALRARNPAPWAHIPRDRHVRPAHTCTNLIIDRPLHPERRREPLSRRPVSQSRRVRVLLPKLSPRDLRLDVLG